MATAVVLVPEESCSEGVVPKWAGHRASVATSSAQEGVIWLLQRAALAQAVAAAQVAAEVVALEGEELPSALGA